MPATNRLGAALSRGPILLDAAMGTRLVARGIDLGHDDPSLWCLSHPDMVFDIHRCDIQAGADALMTNTFGANRAWLDQFSAADRVHLINRQAVELARIAAGPDRLVLGSIGPTASDFPAVVAEQAEALADGGADALVLETHRLDQAEATLHILRDFSHLPILVSLYEWPEPVRESALRLVDLGARAIGSNCLSLASVPTMARKLREAWPIPLWMKPSAGLPGLPLETPEAFASVLPELLGHGVRFIGGCCGTTEAHVAALRAAIDAPRTLAEAD